MKVNEVIKKLKAIKADYLDSETSTDRIALRNEFEALCLSASIEIKNAYFQCGELVIEYRNRVHIFSI